MAEETSVFLSFRLIVLIVGGLILAGGLFGLIYWMMSRGKDDESA